MNANQISLDPETRSLEELESFSNSVVDLIENKQLEEAAATAQVLLVKYPDQIDGLCRLAMVHEAKGETAAAIRLYEEAIAFTRTHDGFDEDSRCYYAEKIKDLRKALCPATDEI